MYELALFKLRNTTIWAIYVIILGLLSKKWHIVLKNSVIEGESLGLEEEKRQTVLKLENDLKNIGDFIRTVDRKWPYSPIEYG